MDDADDSLSHVGTTDLSNSEIAPPQPMHDPLRAIAGVERTSAMAATLRLSCSSLDEGSPRPRSQTAALRAEGSRVT